MGVNLQPLCSLRAQWQTNLQSLRLRDPSLAEMVESHQPNNEYLFEADPHRFTLARQFNGRIEPLPCAVPAGSARDIARKLYPNDQCTEPLMIAGLDQGWLWDRVYRLDCQTPRTPGHRPPLYYLVRDTERLWVAMHIHDWSKLLSDPRVRLFVGNDAVEQCRLSMTENINVPWAKLCVTIDPALWPAGVTVDSLWQGSHQAANIRMQAISRQIETMYVGFDAKSIARRLRGERLRIMGITSHFTTFLKHSMSDWLESLERLGHETRVVMEEADHEMTNPVVFAEAVADFRPDLILMIDHYRAEIPGLPRQIPCVMWVQDHLPNIFNPKAGAAQGPRDYCLGFGRLAMCQSYGYPRERYMPAQVGVNEARFAPQRLTDAQYTNHVCDVSFVSHASTPATMLLTEQLNRTDATGRKLLIDVFEQMRAIYDGGRMITHALLIDRMIDASLQRLRVQLDEPSKQSLFEFFNLRVNNALFRHQALSWVAESDVNLHIYGRGWEQHPAFARFARGIACNQSQLGAIYQASRINLQITPFGAVHQRLLDGLAAGGFFLIRQCPGDLVENIYRELYEWCRANGIEDDDSLRQAAAPQVQAGLKRIESLLGVSPFDLNDRFIDLLQLAADGGYIRSAASIWPEYADVSFDTRQQLHDRMKHFLQNDQQRRQIAKSMRKPVIDRLSYTATSQRLLEFVADNLARGVIVAREVAA